MKFFIIFSSSKMLTFFKYVLKLFLQAQIMSLSYSIGFAYLTDIFISKSISIWHILWKKCRNLAPLFNIQFELSNVVDCNSVNFLNPSLPHQLYLIIMWWGSWAPFGEHQEMGHPDISRNYMLTHFYPRANFKSYQFLFLIRPCTNKSFQNPFKNRKNNNRPIMMLYIHLNNKK